MVCGEKLREQYTRHVCFASKTKQRAMMTVLVHSLVPVLGIKVKRYDDSKFGGQDRTYSYENASFWTTWGAKNPGAFPPGLACKHSRISM